MKTRFLLTAIVAMISSLISPSAFAQIIPVNEVEIDWATYASTLEEALASSGNVYLYAPAQTATGGKAGFLARQGSYDVCAVLRDMGMRLKIENDTQVAGKYNVQSSAMCGQDGHTSDPGYFGYAYAPGAGWTMFVDRYKGEDDYKCSMNFYPSATSGSVPTYQITNGGYKYSVSYDHGGSVGARTGIIVVTATVIQGGVKPIICTGSNRINAGDVSALGEVSDRYQISGTYGGITGPDKAENAAKDAVNNPNNSEYAAVWAWINGIMADCEARTNSAPRTNAVNWYIIKESDYRDAIIAQTTQTYINVTGLTNDPRFNRNDRFEGYWSWSGTGSYNIGLNSNVSTSTNSQLQTVTSTHAAFSTAEVTGTGKLTQTVTVPKPGLYAISCQGFYVGDGANSNSYLYAQSNSKTQQVLLSKISSADAVTFSNSCSNMPKDYYEDKTIDVNRSGWFRQNTAAGSLLMGGDIWSSSEGKYVSSLYLKVEPVAGWETNGIQLTFGVNKTSDTGAAYVDNFKLIYVGQEDIIFDERATEQDNGEYTEPTTLVLRRTFTKDKWNPIILPMAISGNQLKQVFGDGVKLSKLAGLKTTKEDGVTSHCINFTTVDLTNSGLEPDECYVIKVTKDPDIPKGSTYIPVKLESVTVPGPAYRIFVDGQKSYNYSNPVTGYCTTSDGTVYYTGYYAKQTGSYEAGSFIMDGGSMYHLTSAWGSYKYASEWNLTVSTEKPTSSVKFVMSIDGKNEGDATGIINIEMTDDTLSKENTAIYNLSGQKVGDDVKALPKGLYIRNGRKFLVK